MASQPTELWCTEDLLASLQSLHSQQIPGVVTKPCADIQTTGSFHVIQSARLSSRSSKMEEVKENPWSEICWYMPESREQYRLSGKLYIIRSDEKDEQLKKVWHPSAAHCHIDMLCMTPAAPTGVVMFMCQKCFLPPQHQQQ